MTKSKKKVNIRLIVLILACIGLLLLAAVIIIKTTPPHYKKYSFKGNGTETAPYEISTLSELIEFRDLVNQGFSFFDSYFIQTSDIDFSSIDSWVPIGVFGTGRYFSGKYDGQGHVMTNVRIHNDGGNNGLFGFLQGEIRNLGIESGLIEGTCIGSITSHGGPSALIINCYNNASLKGTYRCGGIADNISGSIIFCWNTGEIINRDEIISGEISSYYANEIIGCIGKTGQLVPEGFLGELKESASITDFNSLKDAVIFSKQAMIRILKEMDDSGRESITSGNIFSFNESSAENGILAYDSEPNKHIKANETGLILLDHAYVIVLLVACFAFFIIFLSFKSKSKNVTNEKSSNENDIEKTDKLLEKTRLKGIILTLVFSLILTLAANYILFYKRGDGVTTIENYYEQPKGTVDVLFLGSSRAGVNIDCEELWKNEGISSYMLWGSIQPFWSSYFYLNEAIKTNKPQILVLEVREAMFNSEYSDDARQYANVSGIRFSHNKLKAIQAAAPQERWIDLLLGFPIYHSRYAELSKIDFNYYPWNGALKSVDKGSTPNYGAGKRINYGSAEDISTIAYMTYKNEFYLRRIIETAQEDHIEVVLVATPYEMREVAQPYMNHVQLIASEYSVPFLNFNLMDRETGFSLEDFYEDNSHLNTNGARKISRYLGKWLKDNYDIEDHRGDEKYGSWDIFSEQYENEYFGLIDSSSDYLAELIRDDRTVYFIKLNVNINDLYFRTFVEQMSDLGFDTGFASEADNLYCKYQSTRSPDLFETNKLDTKTEVSIGDQNLEIDQTDSVIRLDNKSIIQLVAGVICIIYDEKTKEIVDISIVFDPAKEGLMNKDSEPIGSIDHFDW